MSHDNWDIRSRILATESEIDNLKLLDEFGKPAIDEDLWVFSEVLTQLKDELVSEEGSLATIEAAIAVREEKVEKELLIAEKDLFNYIRNNKKVQEQVVQMEEKAKALYADLVEVGMNNAEIEKLARNLL